MRELHVVALSEDGRSVLLAPSKKASDGAFRLKLDAKLTAALRGDVPRLGETSVRDTGVSPKDIQARMRAGESAQQIADSAGVPVARVERFAGPVLSERERIIDEARAAFLTRGRLGPSLLPLGDAVEAALAETASLRPESVEWTARRLDSGHWLVQISYVARARTRTASWVLDPSTRSITASDAGSSVLGHRGDEPVRRVGATAAAVRKPAARKPAAGKAPARKSAARKAPVRKATPSKAAARPAAKKSTSGRTAVQPAAVVRKAAAPRRAPKSAPAAERRLPAKQTAVRKKAPAKKPSTRATAAPLVVEDVPVFTLQPVVETARSAARPARKAAAKKAPKPAAKKAPAKRPAAAKAAAAERPAAAKAALAKRPAAAKAAPAKRPAAAKAAPAEVVEPVVEPAAIEPAAPVAEPVAPVAEPAARVSPPAARDALIPGDRPPSLRVVPTPPEPEPEPVVPEPEVEPDAPPAPRRRAAGERASVPAWADVLLGITPRSGSDKADG